MLLCMRQPGMLIVCLVLSSLTGCTSLRKSDVVSVEVQLDTQRARELNAEGIDALMAGDTQRANQLFSSALEADQTFGPAWNNLGRICFDAQNYYAAALKFQKAAEFMPEHGDPPNNLGLVMEAAGRTEDAISYFETAVSINGNNPVYLANLIRVRLQRGDPPEMLRAEIHQLRFVEHRPEWRDWVNDHVNLFDNPRLEVAPEINNLSALLNQLNQDQNADQDNSPRVILDSSQLSAASADSQPPLTPDTYSTPGPTVYPPALQPAPELRDPNMESGIPLDQQTDRTSTEIQSGLGNPFDHAVVGDQLQTESSGNWKPTSQK